jgi:hypothetical protein
MYGPSEISSGRSGDRETSNNRDAETKSPYYPTSNSACRRVLLNILAAVEPVELPALDAARLMRARNLSE